MAFAPTAAAFRDAARPLLAARVAPELVTWDDGSSSQQGLFGDATTLEPASQSGAAPAPRVATVRVPRAFVDLIELVALHADAGRWDALYRALFRLVHEDARLLDIAVDPDVARLRRMERDVRREEHRMHAYVRFARVSDDAGEHLVAWFAPEHPILPLVAPFFARRYPSDRFTIFGPDASASWDGSELTFGAGAPRSVAPDDDALDDLFRTYYGAIFNPARTNLAAMRTHLPARRWTDLPELRGMHDLVRAAPRAVATMDAAARPAPSASASLAEGAADLDELGRRAERCRACPLHEAATQVVRGEGPTSARLVVVGEQPGDEEDRLGRPFVGPAGRVFDEALAAAGLDRSAIYVTNAVKHFKWTPAPRGKRRIHSRASPAEMEACRGWLDAELAIVRPAMILCLGATAARTFLGGRFSIKASRGQVFSTPWAPWWMATWHPSALLRMPDEATRGQARTDFFADVARAAAALAGHAG